MARLRTMNRRRRSLDAWRRQNERDWKEVMLFLRAQESMSPHIDWEAGLIVKIDGRVVRWRA